MRPQLPADVKDCELSFTAKIGMDASQGDNFRFSVVTPAALTRCRYTGWGKDQLILQEFAWVLVDNYLDNLLSSIRGDSWEEVARQIHEFMDWEKYTCR
ncbi:Imm8 family immunity protein [Pseudoxanthomonas sp.]|uniref:Imm8 family immunity protein n=1 Tax=Pseudoxanthomonas sp. TaxID=1871049 RepID=UPI003F7E056D